MKNIKSISIAVVFSMLVTLLCGSMTVLAGDTPVNVSLGKTAKRVVGTTETDVSKLLTADGWMEMTPGLGWSTMGYIQIDLERPATITEVSWTKSNWGSTLPLKIYAANSLDFSDSVEIGQIASDASKTTEISSTEAFRYVRLEKNTAADWYPVRMQVMGIPLPLPSSELSALTLSEGFLAPEFNKTVTSYTASVAYETESVDVLAVSEETTAAVVIKKGGVEYEGGASIPLEVGDNVVIIAVTSGDGMLNQEYSVVITRNPQEEDIKPVTLSYGKTAIRVVGNSTTDVSKLFSEGGWESMTPGIGWSSTGYLQVDLEIPARITKLKIGYGNWGTKVSVKLIAANTENFSDAVVLGQVENGKTETDTIANKNAYRYVRIEKTAQGDWYPTSMQIDGVKGPFRFSAVAPASGIIEADEDIIVAFTDYISTGVSSEGISLTYHGQPVPFKVKASKATVVISPVTAWENGGVYKLSIDADVIESVDERICGDAVEAEFRVAGTPVSFERFKIENNVLSYKAESVSGDTEDIRLLIARYNAKNILQDIVFDDIEVDSVEDGMGVSEYAAAFAFSDFNTLKTAVSADSNGVLPAQKPLDDKVFDKVLDVVMETDKIKVSGVETAPAAEQTILIVKGENISLGAITKSNIVGITRAITDKNGKYEAEIFVDENMAQGYYTVISSNNHRTTPEPSTFYWLSKTDKNSIAASISDMSKTELETYFTKPANYNNIKAIQIDIDTMKTVDMSKLCSAIEKLSLSEEPSKLAEQINEQIALRKVSETTASEFDTVIRKYNEILKLPLNEDLYLSVIDSKLTEFTAERIIGGDYETAEALQKKFNSSNMIVLFTKSLSVSAAEDFARDNNEFFGFDFSGKYARLTDIQQSDVIKSAMKGTTVEDIKKKFDSAVSSYSKKTSSGGSSDSGSGSSSSGSKKPISLPVTGTQLPGTTQTEGGNNPQVIGFKDLSSDFWAYNQIKKLADLGAISGNENGEFKPNDMITREQFVKILICAIGKHNENAKTEFSDVEASAWYSSYIASAMAANIVTGISETEFGVGMPVKRQDMAAMIERAVSTLGISITAEREYLGFADEEQISEYALSAIKSLYSKGMINGMDENKFEPDGFATRAQAATIIYNLMDKASILNENTQGE